MLDNYVSLAIREKHHERIQLEDNGFKAFLKDLAETTESMERIERIKKFLKDLDDRVKRTTGEGSFYLLCVRLIEEYYRREKGMDVDTQNIPQMTAIYMLYTRAGKSILDTLKIEDKDKRFIWDFIEFVGSYLKYREEKGDEKFEERVREYESKIKPVETTKQKEEQEKTKNGSKEVKKLLKEVEQEIKKLKQLITLKDILILIFVVIGTAVIILILSRLFLR